MQDVKRDNATLGSDHQTGGPCFYYNIPALILSKKNILALTYVKQISWLHPLKQKCLPSIHDRMCALYSRKEHFNPMHIILPWIVDVNICYLVYHVFTPESMSRYIFNVLFCPELHIIKTMR